MDNGWQWYVWPEINRVFFRFSPGSSIHGVVQVCWKILCLLFGPKPRGVEEFHNNGVMMWGFPEMGNPRKCLVHRENFFINGFKVGVPVNFHKSVLSAAHACEGCLGGVGCIRFQKYAILGFRMAHFRLLIDPSWWFEMMDVLRHVLELRQLHWLHSWKVTLTI